MAAIFRWERVRRRRHVHRVAPAVVLGYSASLAEEGQHKMAGGRSADEEGAEVPFFLRIYGVELGSRSGYS